MANFTSLIGPGAYGTLNKLVGLTGGTAQALAGQPNQGAQKVRQTMGQLGKQPQEALPGGGTFPGGTPLTSAIAQETPAATLSSIQAEPQYKEGLAGVEAGAQGLANTSTNINTSFVNTLQQQLSQLIGNLGGTRTQGALGGGGLGILSMLLGL